LCARTLAINSGRASRLIIHGSEFIEILVTNRYHL